MQLVGEFYRAVGDVPSVRKSVMKMDFPRCTDYKQCVYWPRAKALVREKLHYVWKNTGPCNSEIVLHRMNMKTSAGFPLGHIGLKKKGDCVKNNSFMTYLFCSALLRDLPVWKVSPKTEWLSLQDLLEGKVRTFIIPPFHLVFWCVFLYYYQNLMLKMYWWSAYGFNPYQGGTNRMGQKLKPFYRKICFDVRGWDRLLPILRTVYNTRQKYIPDHWQPHAVWVENNTISSCVLLPNGDVVMRDCGNNSGSGNTTSDNIVSHMFIYMLALLCLYDGDEDKAMACVADLFGDDNTSGIVRTPKSDDEIEQSFRSTYRLFGLELDPFVISTEVEDMEFLGFKFTQINGYYIPKYNVGRLCSAFAFEIDAHDADAEIAKAFSLTIMSCGNGEEVFNKLATALDALIHTVPCKNSTYLLDVGAPTFYDAISFCAGLEVKSSSFKLFNGGWRYKKNEDELQ
nr:RNA-dependent RNA polymerase [Flumine Astrovirus 12]